MSDIAVFDGWVASGIVERAGWVLVHSLWQFALIASVAAALMPLMRRRSAQSRYVLLVAALLLVAMTPPITWSLLPEARVLPSGPSLPADERERALVGRGDFAGNAAEEGPQPFATSVRESSLVSSIPVEAEAVVVGGPLNGAPAYASWSERLAGTLRPWLAWIVAGWSMGVVLFSLRPLLGWRTLR